jgi:hypothetical protein
MPDVTDFDVYKVTNANVRFESAGVLGTVKKFGCLGTVSTESELRTIIKTCEGDTVKEVTKITKLNVTVSAHVEVAVLRSVFGLTNEGLKVGVFGLGKASNPGKGVITFDALNLEETETKLMAYPNMQFTTGFIQNIENGIEEIALTELTFSAFKDDNGFFYYEAFTSETTDEALVDTWHTAFTPDLVKLVVGP